MRAFSVIAFTAAVALASASSCVEERKLAQARVDAGMLGVEVPVCEENGDWAAFQCNFSTGMCKCVHPNGEILKAPNSRLESCGCIVHRDQQLKKGVPEASLSICEESGGFYKKIQCRGSQCQCADGLTGELKGEPRHITEVHLLRC